MNSPQVIGLGELLWDCFPGRRLPGGAPANVAFHAQQLGLAAAVVTRVGDDLLGRELLEFLHRQGLSTDLVQRDPVHGTGTVTIELSPSASASYEFLKDSAWDFLEVTPPLAAAFQQAQAVCFGTLGQRCETSRRTIQHCLSLAAPECLLVYDINLRPPFYERSWIEQSLGYARLVKLNDEEVAVLGPLLEAGPLTSAEFSRWVLDRYPAELVCITRGSEGCLVISRTESCDLPGEKVQVVDTVGAGDAFTAALIWSRLEGWELARSARFANRVGALVASRAGAMPVLVDELRELKEAL